MDTREQLERIQAEYRRIGGILADLERRLSEETDPIALMRLQCELTAAGGLLTAFAGPAMERERLRRMGLALAAGPLYT